MSWGIEALGVGELWSRGITGRGVLVGHVDSGVDGTHPALRGAVRRLVAFVEGEPREMAPDGVAEYSGHGTTTAGVIAGRPVSHGGGSPIRFGVAPEAALVCYALELGGGAVVSQIAWAIDRMAEEGVSVVCLALGRSKGEEALGPALRRATDAGILPVVASGNEPDATSAMNAHPECLSVGAAAFCGGGWRVWSGTQEADFGGRTVPDLAAPGERVFTSAFDAGRPDRRYVLTDGTSMAAAHVAGLAALLKSARPEATGAEIRRALIESCAWDGEPTSRAGRGVPHALRALDRLDWIPARCARRNPI